MVKKSLLALLLLALLGFGYLWLNRDAFVTEFNQQRADEAQTFRQAGLEYGRSHDQLACLDKALADFDTQCTGFSCTVRYGKFLNACLETAAPAPAFCQGVPIYQEEITELEKAWARDTCWSRDVRGDGCRVLLRQQQYFCESMQPKSTASAGSSAP